MIALNFGNTSVRDDDVHGNRPDRGEISYAIVLQLADTGVFISAQLRDKALYRGILGEGTIQKKKEDKNL